MMDGMRTLIAALTLPLVLAACGGQAKGSASPVETTPPTVAKVSDATICGLLIDDGDPSLMQRSIDVISKKAEPGDDVVADEIADSLDGLSERAESSRLATHLGVMASEMRAIFGGEKSETADWQASALEVNTVCGGVPRF